ncbi:hypothetical protein CYMTET_35657 [Cymbomonas tetramitiformis]|uniref:Uncharacterized protein n=1 Tax=Cymbomonas tetramitiformis TaxID=36881 RepID=A0AAE0KNZ8_9CHLO|nr:hypothetical protein CYMTET_35657 [Cymbomonas tetramitiformis]|eukprot:gene61-88_t
MPDFSALSCLAFGDDVRDVPLEADPRHCPRTWCGRYERTNELSLKEVAAGCRDCDRSMVRIDNVQVRYRLPEYECAASRALLRQLQQPDVRRRDRVHLFWQRDEQTQYLGAHVIVSGGASHVVLHLLRAQPDRMHVARRSSPRLDQLAVENLVRSLVPSGHVVRVDASVEGSEPDLGEAVDIRVMCVCSADVRRCHRVTWRFLLQDDSEEGGIREWRQRVRCRALRDALLQRVVLVRARVDDANTQIVSFRDFSDDDLAEREHESRNTLLDALAFDAPVAWRG